MSESMTTGKKMDRTLRDPQSSSGKARSRARRVLVVYRIYADWGKLETKRYADADLQAVILGGLI